MIFYFQPKHALKALVIKHVNYYSVHHRNSAKKFKVETLAIHDCMKRKFLAVGTVTRDPIKKCITAEEEYEMIINTMIDKASSHYAAVDLKKTFDVVLDHKHNELMNFADERSIDKLFNQMLPNIHVMKEVLRITKENVWMAFKLEKHIADPFTEEFGPNKTPSQAFFEDYER